MTSILKDQPPKTPAFSKQKQGGPFGFQVYIYIYIYSYFLFIYIYINWIEKRGRVGGNYGGFLVHFPRLVDWNA